MGLKRVQSEIGWYNEECGSETVNVHA
uniref:Uncharacterized protein n=1 Tax=Arundo donax TaxID=35708 RepID=A0A0A9CFI8_ARUDO